MKKELGYLQYSIFGVRAKTLDIWGQGYLGSEQKPFTKD